MLGNRHPVCSRTLPCHADFMSLLWFDVSVLHMSTAGKYQGSFIASKCLVVAALHASSSSSSAALLDDSCFAGAFMHVCGIHQCTGLFNIPKTDIPTAAVALRSA
jgi:hypothetical protein